MMSNATNKIRKRRLSTPNACNGSREVVNNVRNQGHNIIRGVDTNDSHDIIKHQIDDIPSYGKSLLPLVWKGDPASSLIKALQVLSVLMGLMYLWWSVDIMVPLFGLFDNFDEKYEINSLEKDSTIESILGLLYVTLGLSSSTTKAIVFMTLVVHVLPLLLADWLVQQPTTIKNPNESFIATCPWPKSWNTDNTQCYHEMFSEPTRYGKILRRPGNTLSNTSYVFASIILIYSLILQSKQQQYQSSLGWFWYADCVFGIMLLLLSIFSTLWHASNATWTHYCDLWSMESCIIYLIVRYTGLGTIAYFAKVDKNVDHRSDSSGEEVEQSYQSYGFSVGIGCAIVYLCIVVALGKNQLQAYNEKWLHRGCRFSVRSRLLGISDIPQGHGHHDITIGVICAFAALPVFYAVIPVLMQTFLLGSVGSVLAGRWTFRTLVIGWSYRMTERWAVDGNGIVLNIFYRDPSSLKNQTKHDNTQRTTWQTIVQSIVSPTAVLHATTGITLLAGYIHARSVQMVLLDSLRDRP